MTAGVFASMFSISERFEKLYRTLYIRFLQKDFVHKDDIKAMLAELNARITAVETGVQGELASLAAGISAHTHPVTTVGGPTSQAGTAAPPAAPPYQSAYAPAAGTTYKEPALIAKANTLFATGPASSPLSSGVSPQELRANTKIAGEIGVV